MRPVQVSNFTETIKYNFQNFSDINSKDASYYNTTNTKSGNMTFNVRKQILKMVLKSLLSNAEHIGDTNIFKTDSGNKPLTTMRVEQGNSTIDYLTTFYEGVSFDSIDLSCKPKEFIIANVKWSADSVSSATYEIPPIEYEDVPLAIFYSINIQFDDGVNPQYALYPLEFNLSLTDSIEDEFYVNSSSREEIVNSGQYSLTGSFKLNCDEHDIFKAQIASQNVLNGVDMLLSINDIDGNLIMEIDAPIVLFDENTRTLNPYNEVYDIKFSIPTNGTQIRIYD